MFMTTCNPGSCTHNLTHLLSPMILQVGAVGTSNFSEEGRGGEGGLLWPSAHRIHALHLYSLNPRWILWYEGLVSKPRNIREGTADSFTSGLPGYPHPHPHPSAYLCRHLGFGSSGKPVFLSQLWRNAGVVIPSSMPSGSIDGNAASGPLAGLLGFWLQR